MSSLIESARQVVRACLSQMELWLPRPSAPIAEFVYVGQYAVAPTSASASVRPHSY